MCICRTHPKLPLAAGGERAGAAGEAEARLREPEGRAAEALSLEAGADASPPLAAAVCPAALPPARGAPPRTAPAPRPPDPPPHRHRHSPPRLAGATAVLRNPQWTRGEDLAAPPGTPPSPHPAEQRALAPPQPGWRRLAPAASSASRPGALRATRACRGLQRRRPPRAGSTTAASYCKAPPPAG